MALGTRRKLISLEFLRATRASWLRHNTSLLSFRILNWPHQFDHHALSLTERWCVRSKTLSKATAQAFRKNDAQPRQFLEANTPLMMDGGIIFFLYTQIFASYRKQRCLTQVERRLGLKAHEVFSSIALGIDPDINTVNVDNRVQTAMANLPTKGQVQRLIVQKR